MELWRRCFEDTDEFIRFYFERKYSDANSLIYEENGKALSALQMLPYPMRWENVTVDTSYISGACGETAFTAGWPQRPPIMA